MTFHLEIDEDDAAERFQSEYPPHAQEKRAHLALLDAERSGYVSALHERRNALYDKRRSYESEVRRIQQSDGEFPTKESQARLAKLNGKIAKTNVEAEAISNAMKLPPTMPPHVLDEGAREVRRPGYSFVDARVSVKVGKSDSLPEKIAASRNVIAKLTSKRGAIRNALLPKDVALKRAIGDIEKEAAKGAPDFTGNARLIRTSLNLKPRQGRTQYSTFFIDTGTQEIELENTPHTMKFLMKDALIAAATEAISKLYEGNPLVVAESERTARIAEVDALILAESRVEEALIEIAEERGLKVLRRPNAPPLAVLGVALVKDEEEFG